ncbi:UTRA domain-containing protein [Salinarimonas rosea]|uniref:UTRA domain-containing protein n=1 Tax=Salinarimonas rosea TaxID=552063 RepID=UPI0003F6FD9C|nr:UTRA domain-containing protein [Salinarimonas rosea]
MDAPSSAAASAPASLKARIRADIERRIHSGEWPPGHRLPTERELTAQYGCARMTVNGALAALVEAGFIERRRRAGSFVRRPPLRSAALEIPDIAAQVRAGGEAYRLELMERVVGRATAAERVDLSLGAGARVLRLAARHFADGAPIAYEERLIPLDAVPEAEAADFAREPPGSWLLQRVPWHEAQNVVSAEAADARLAARLGVPEGAALLVVERRTWRGGRTLTRVRTWHLGARQRVVARFGPSGAQGG